MLRRRTWAEKDSNGATSGTTKNDGLNRPQLGPLSTVCSRTELQMATTLELKLAPTPKAASAARIALHDLEEALPPDLLGEVRLMVSELVTNSIRHAGQHQPGPIALRASVDEELLCVEVEDTGPGFHPAAAPARGAIWVAGAFTSFSRWRIGGASGAGAGRPGCGSRSTCALESTRAPGPPPTPSRRVASRRRPPAPERPRARRAAAPASARQLRRIEAVALVTEVAPAGEGHRHARAVGRLDHLVIAHRAARLDDRPDPRLDRQLRPVGEREERVRGQRCSLQRAACQAFSTASRTESTRLICPAPIPTVPSSFARTIALERTCLHTLHANSSSLHSSSLGRRRVTTSISPRCSRSTSRSWTRSPPMTCLTSGSRGSTDRRSLSSSTRRFGLGGEDLQRGFVEVRGEDQLRRTDRPPPRPARDRRRG